MKPFLALFIPLCFLGCPAEPKTCLDGSCPPPTYDSGTLCENACDNMKTLGCPEAEGSKAMSCTELCEKATRPPYIGPRLNPVCVSSAPDVAVLRAKCNVRCLQ